MATYKVVCNDEIELARVEAGFNSAKSRMHRDWAMSQALKVTPFLLSGSADHDKLEFVIYMNWSMPEIIRKTISVDFDDLARGLYPDMPVKLFKQVGTEWKEIEAN